MNTLYLLARIGTQRVAFAADTIESVVDLGEVKTVPFAPPPIVGLVALRSSVVTVVDAGLATGGVNCPANRRAIIVEVEGHRYAIRLDAADDVVALASASAPDRALLGEGWGRVVLGALTLADETALLLDPALLVAINVPVTLAA